MQSKTTIYWFSLLIFLGLFFYWLVQIWSLITFELAGGEENYLGNFLLFLMSWLMVFMAINLVAWLNFKYLFLKWRESKMTGLVFWSLELGVLAFIFELLKWLSQYEPEIMKENFILMIVITVYFLAFTWVFDMVNFRRKQAKLVQEKDKAELNLLQSQLNPHFLFNAMNTCYNSAIDEDSPKTADHILQISDLMRFALEKSNQDTISIEEEIGFLEKYIRLQKERFHHFTEEGIQIELNWDGVEVPISPMLIQPFLENAFKFASFEGSGGPNFGLSILVEEGKLVLKVENPYLEKLVQQYKGTGKGIQLVRQRLNSLYPKKHQLVVEDDSNIFKVCLSIDLNR